MTTDTMTSASTQLPIHGSMVSWYQPSSGPQSAQDIAREAYLDAIRYLRKEVRNGHAIEQLVEGMTTIQDVQSVVEKAKSKYESMSEATNARRWLQRFSTGVMYYSPVFDILSQHHPEYVALAWGSVKFVLMGIINHATLISEFSRALAEIGEALWQTNLSVELYRIEHMKEAVSRLMNSARRAISSVLKPFELDYKDTIEQIKLCSQTVNNIASAASCAELRDLHNIVKEQRKQDLERDKKLHQMQAHLAMIESSTAQIIQAGTAQISLSENIHVEVLKINPHLQDIQFFNIIQTLRPENSAEEALIKAQSLSRRNTSTNLPSKDLKVLLGCLSRWISAEGSALFVVRVALRAEAKAKDFVVEVINMLRSLPYGVIWSLSPSQGKSATLQGVIKSLVFQALVHDPTILRKYTKELDATKFMSTHTEAEWVSLLSQLLSKLPKCFIVIEAQDLFQANREDPEWARQFFQLFQKLIDQAKSSGNMLKILVLGYGNRQLTLQNLPGNGARIVSSIQRPIPMPAHLRRVGGRKKNPIIRKPLKAGFCGT